MRRASLLLACVSLAVCLSGIGRVAGGTGAESPNSGFAGVSRRLLQGTYVVQRGDTLSSIASGSGVSLQALINANPQISDPDFISPGQTINIPSSGEGRRLLQVTYTVRQGDTLSSIARRYGVSLQALINANPQISDPDSISPRQTINIPSSGGGRRLLRGTYTVRQGDTLSSIARRYGVSLQALINANPQISDPDSIFPGDRVNIP